MTTGTPEPTTRSGYAENAGFWTKIIREGLDPYRLQLTDKAVLGAVAPTPGAHVLDVGCGEGYMSRHIARAGATVTAIDPCGELIDAASQAADEEALPITHRVAAAEDLPMDDSIIDTVVCNHVFNDIADLDGAVREFARVLRPGGRLVAMMLHPCLYQPRANRDQPAAIPPPTDYFRERTLIQHFTVAGITSPTPVTVHIRPLEHVMTALSSAGFAITGIAEPHPTPAQMADDPWWQDNFTRPMFLLITASAGL